MDLTKMITYITYGSVLTLLIILGIIFSFGKGAMLIAGYNTMSEESKKKYNQVALCKFMGKTMFGLAFGTSLWMLSEIVNISWIFYIGHILFFSVIFFTLIYVNTSKKFRK